VSDQDFFFDEDEKPEEKPEPKKSGSSSTKQAPAEARSTVAPASERTVTMTVASLIGVVALLVGVIVGILIPAGGSTSLPAPTQGGTGVSAPQLSPEELESGSLPEGHPDITGMGGEAAPPTDTATGSAGATGTE